MNPNFNTSAESSSFPNDFQAMLAQEKANAEAMAYPILGQDVTDLMAEAQPISDPVVAGWLNAGESLAIVGSPKVGKSFFALQLCVHVALGIPFLGKETKPRKVYYADVEVGKVETRRRIVRMCDRLGLNLDSLKGKLFVGSFKGQSLTWSRVRNEVNHFGATLAIVDPFYRFVNGDEKSPWACNLEIQEMEKFATDGITLGVVFHAPKGQDGDRRTVDRISGSSVLARFVENIVDLKEHNTVSGALVIDTALRNYPSVPESPIRLDNGAFVTDCNLANTAATCRNNPTLNNGPEADESTRFEFASLLRNKVVNGKTSLVEDVRSTLAARGIKLGKMFLTSVLEKMITEGLIDVRSGRPMILSLSETGSAMYFQKG